MCTGACSEPEIQGIIARKCVKMKEVYKIF